MLNELLAEAGDEVTGVDVTAGVSDDERVLNGVPDTEDENVDRGVTVTAEVPVAGVAAGDDVCVVVGDSNPYLCER